MSRPYIDVDTMPPITNPEWAAWLVKNNLPQQECYRLEALDDEFTQWMASCYATNETGGLVVRNGHVVREIRTIVTTPARREWVTP